MITQTADVYKAICALLLNSGFEFHLDGNGGYWQSTVTGLFISTFKIVWFESVLDFQLEYINHL